MEKVRIGIIGCGFIENAHFLGYRCNPQAEVVAVADLVKKTAEKFARVYGIKSSYGSVEELLDNEKIDAVSVCTPRYEHVEAVTAAAMVGKHILVEKLISTRQVA